MSEPLTILEAMGLSPPLERLRQAKIALLGAPHVPPSRLGLSSLGLLRPRWGVPLWLGLWIVPRRAIVTNLFNHRQTPIAAGWSVRRTQVEDFRGRGLTYDSHNGTDFSIPVGSTVAAAAAGRVVRVWSEFHRGGLKIAIDHGDGLITSSAHLARPLVRVGDVVRAGAPIAISGYSGLDGFATFPWGTPHVHFNVWQDGVPVDPFARQGTQESSLWLTEPPTPAREGGGTVAPTAWDDDAVRRVIEGCLHDETRARLAAIDDPWRRGGEVVAEKNYYPTRFPVDAQLLRAPTTRHPRLSLPFAAADVDGVVFADDLARRPPSGPRRA